MNYNFEFTQALVFILLGVIFFKEEMKRWFAIKFLKTDAPADLSYISGKMNQLAHHFNHETTGLLTDIRDELRYVRKAQEEQYKQTAVILLKVEEVIKYGVPERKP